MNIRPRKLISRAYGIFLMCSICFVTSGLYAMGFGGFLSTLLPSFFSICLFLFFFISGLRFFNNDQKEVNILCVEICLLIQVVQLNILGFHLTNYYGPYLAVGFSDTPNFQILIKFEIFRWLVDNGYSPDRSISVLINCFQLLLYILFLLFKKELRPKESDAFLES